MDNLRIFIIVFAVIASIFGLGGLVFWALDQEDRLIVSHVTLDNKCGIDSAFFVVETTKTNRRVNFTKDTAKIGALSSEKLRLALDPKFGGVTFSGYETTVKEKVRFIADCTGNAHQQSVFNSMREQFN
jgi:hypothetical protein